MRPGDKKFPLVHLDEPTRFGKKGQGGGLEWIIHGNVGRNKQLQTLPELRSR